MGNGAENLEDIFELRLFPAVLSCQVLTECEEGGQRIPAHMGYFPHWWKIVLHDVAWSLEMGTMSEYVASSTRRHGPPYENVATSTFDPRWARSGMLVSMFDDFRLIHNESILTA